MNFKELISKRRACKLFNDKKINEKDLHFILESGVLAPSSHGFEPWKFAQKQVRRFSGSSEENFQRILKIYTHDTDAMNEKELYHFAQLQCYLAMMQMSLAAMSLGIDSCMIGGYEKAKVDNFLNLTYPFETAVILSLGYKAHEPKYSTQRLNFNEVVEFYKEK
ncbi:NAD(P)H-dependent oxidoreductase [Campylobacter coli]|uniref:nitroreductase family protein n=1 Tax=Campylobacter coli TaxID=195 RepID=UPI00126B135F|nr:NAD(P)H-dependent oxidoreductase [Campylobacter coli]EAK5687492.1 NAD(P)H-dependent oxidoreductase [Campylobacter coli]EAL1666459.1 NAD(P)H-dependent oxidoreductase [Campylobacter coli]EDG1811685.1 NAD(P)H-dependent oxidoreductase [Campylobacter coli]EDO9001645.1 NAD(P)H-dependent oxidoreductase [Campylobacter coli]